MTNPFNQFAQQAEAPAEQAPAAVEQPQAPAAEQAPAPAAQQAPAAQPSTILNNAQGTNPAQPVGNLSEMFNNGASVSGDKFKDDLGHAVLLHPTEFLPQFATQHGPTDAVEADWVVLDGPNQGAKRTGLIFASVIVKTLAAALDSQFSLTVGVISQGEAKAGKSAPYLLNPLDADQLQLAEQAAKAFGWA